MSPRNIRRGRPGTATGRKLEILRTAVASGAVLPGRLIVDVGAIAQDFYTRAPDEDLIDAVRPLLDAVSRSNRDVLWVVAPPTTRAARVDEAELRWLVVNLGRIVGEEHVFSSKQPVPSLIAACSVHDVGLISAGIEVRRHLVWPLVCGVSVILDVSTGRVWRTSDAATELVEPIAGPLIGALTGAPFGGAPLVKDAIKYRDRIASGFAAGTPLTDIFSVGLSVIHSRRVG